MSDDAEKDVRELYERVFACWDARDGAGLAAPFLPDGIMIGYDGSVIGSRTDIERAMSTIFGQLKPPPIVTKTRFVRLASPDTAVLHAVAGVVAPGGSDINPALNMVQVMTAVRRDGAWQIASLQSTPAAFHQDPAGRTALTAELRAVLQKSWRA